MTRKIRALIVDDEHDGRTGLMNLLEKYCPEVEVADMAEGVNDAFCKITNLNPQLVFLDIKMDDGTAFDLLKRFTSIDFRIIFVTAYDEYAMDAIHYSAMDYLLKPVRPVLLVEAVKKMKGEFRFEKIEEQIDLLLQPKPQRKKIALPSSDGLIFVPFSSIMRCESDSSYTIFVLDSGRKIMVSRTMKEYETLLPGNTFFRIHKSHIVNLDYISQYINRDGTFVIMENGDNVPIARNRRDEFLAKISMCQ